MLSSRTVTRVLILELLAALVTAVVLMDMRAHLRAQELRGPNMRGYRGPLRIRPTGQARIAIVGGSAAYGFGVDFGSSFGFNVESALNQGWREGYPSYYTDVVNLAAVGDGAASYITTLTDYAYLRPDIVCIYDGYAPVTASSNGGVRHSSALFKATGYMPILPHLFADSPPWDAPDRAVVDPFLLDSADGDVSCDGGSNAWCTAMLGTVQWSLAHGMKVLVATPPHLSRRHELQQASLVEALRKRYRNDRRVRHVSVAHEVDLHDPEVSVDGVYLTARGNQRAGERLVDTIFEMLERP